MATYTVKSGDTLSGIGKRLGVDWHQISGYRSGNPNLIYPGEVLNIPGPSAPSQQQQSQPQQTQQYEAPQQTSAQQIIQASIDKYSQLFDQYKAKYKEYGEKNPFSYDKVLQEEQQKVGQRLDPYYNQTLSDYLTSTERQRTRSLEDERKLLGELSKDTNELTGDVKLNVQKAVDQSREGFADAGLYGSGQQLRSEGQIKAEGQQTVEKQKGNTLQKQQDIESQYKRQQQDLSTEEAQRKRDIERERQYNTQSQSLSETLRRQNQYEFERGQYAGAPPGVNPQQYESQLFSLLR